MLSLLLQAGLNPVQRDTLSRSLNHITDTLSKIVCNTNPQRIMDVELEFGNFWIGLISLVIGLLGAWFGWLAYRFSKKTADNVVRMTTESQFALFADMIRHLYRNIICTLVMARHLTDLKKRDSYPSEDHLLKLKMLPEDTMHLEKYNDNKEIYRKMHELKLLLRNYDMEVEACLIHYKEPGIEYEELIKDLSVLLFKPFYLMKKIIDIEKDICKYEKSKKYGFFRHFFIKKDSDEIDVRNVERNLPEIIISEHFSKLQENLARGKFGTWRANYNYKDYIHMTDLPYKELVNGFGNVSKFDCVISYDWLFSDANTYMTEDTKKEYRSGKVFDVLREYDLFKDYLPDKKEKEVGFLNFISKAISMDMAIKTSEIRFIKMRAQQG